ncbi:ABC transporter substrate binding protein [Desulfobulbus alkaliphilus]|uniref:ABC transporter substrate binding protein n=1 Tax=Desulfobulbus alkaliphilus TaxID=869814 RepID=UPI00196469A5|nr:ABC transporter substrate binding protein [Desulfobulbus alkaliphilus]MBM9536083.1 PAS domain S-box protein [Desulfobulbus alkaliphilus]
MRKKSGGQISRKWDLNPESYVQVLSHGGGLPGLLCFLVLILFTAMPLWADDRERQVIDVGVAWQGKSEMPVRMLAGVENALNEHAPWIRLEIRKELENLVALEAVIHEFEAGKQAMVILRSNGAELLGRRGVAIPTFIGGINNPVELGVAESLNRPKANISGVTYYLPGRLKLETLRQVYPAMTRFLLLVEAGHPGSLIDVKETTDAAIAMGLSARPVFCATIEDGIAAIRTAEADDVLVFGVQELLMDNAAVLLEAAEERVVFSHSEQAVEQGALAGIVADEHKLGWMLGMMLVDHLVNGRPIDQMPILNDPEPRLRLNHSAVERLRDRIPFTVRSLARSEQILASIHKSAPTGIGMVQHRVLTQVNDYILDLTGYEREELLGQNARILYPTQADYDFVGEEKYHQISAHGTGSVETRWQHKDGSIRHVILSSTPLDPNDLSQGVTFTVLDITARKLAEANLAIRTRWFMVILAGGIIVLLILVGRLATSLRQRHIAINALGQNEENLATTLHSIGDGVIATDARGRVVNMNPVAEQLCGWELSEAQGRTLSEVLPLVNAKTRQPAADPVKEVLVSGQMVGLANHTLLLARDGAEYQIADSAAPIRDRAGNVTGVVLVFSDVTEKYAQEERLQQSEEKLATLFAAMSEMVVLHELVFDRAGKAVNYRIIDANHAFTQVTGIPRDQAVGRLATDVYGTEEPPYLQEFSRVALTGEPYVYTTWYEPMGKHFAISVVSPHQNHFATVTTDITEQKEAEAALQASLDEKAVLLREVHHRVKNNMAAMVGLFNLQCKAIADPQARSVLTELSSRVQAMSLVHEKLYRSESLARIDFQEYLQSLVTSLCTSFGSADLHCEVNAHGVDMPLDLAVPCGMIINELVTNALKYAFPGEQRATEHGKDCLQISMTHDNNSFTLSVADNGVGLPPDFDLDTTKTLGLTLVRMLGEHQLGGQYHVDRRAGTRWTLVFPDRSQEQTDG